MRKIFFVFTGLICAGLGTVGVVTPLLPTTPFYLLTALWFAKGSARFHTWFTSKNLYKKHLEGFVDSRSMTLRRKLAILIPVTVILFLTGLLIDELAVRIIIAVLLAVKYWYFIFKFAPSNLNSEPQVRNSNR